MGGIAGRWIGGLALALGLTLTSGCALALLGAGAGAGAATYAYSQGDLRAHEDVPLDRGWRATLAALEALDYQVANVTKDAQAGNLIARQGGAEAPEVTINLTRQAANVTEFRIRVGVFGDEERSRYLMNRIRAELGRGPDKQAEPSRKTVVGVPTDSAVEPEPALPRRRVQGRVVE